MVWMGSACVAKDEAIEFGGKGKRRKTTLVNQEAKARERHYLLDRLLAVPYTHHTLPPSDSVLVLVVDGSCVCYKG